MKVSTRLLAAAMASVLVPAAVQANDLSLLIQDGRVRLSARNASVGQILAEWERVGQTRIINADQVGGPPLTLELDWVPERVALDTILRSASGYLAAPRPGGVPGASIYDRILVMPTSRVVASSPVPLAGPTIPQPPPVPDGMAPETLSFEPPVEEQQEPAPEDQMQMEVPGGDTGPGQISQPFTPGQFGNPGGPGAYPFTQPGAGPVGTNPWNVQGGTANPGVISPPPAPPQDPNNPEPQ